MVIQIINTRRSIMIISNILFKKIIISTWKKNALKVAIGNYNKLFSFGLIQYTFCTCKT